MKNPLQSRENPFNQILRRVWGDELGLIDESGKSIFSHHHANVSLSEDEGHVFVDAALPGLEESEIEITLDKGLLWIRGEKKEEHDNKKYYYKGQRSYSYQLALPENVDESVEPQARYDKGMIHITFMKNKGEKAKKIHIRRS